MPRLFQKAADAASSRSSRKSDPRAALIRAERARRRIGRRLSYWQASRLYRTVTAARDLLAATELRLFALLLAPPGLTALFRCLILPLLTDDFPLLPLDGATGGLFLFLSLLLATYRVPLCRIRETDRLFPRLLLLPPMLLPSGVAGQRGIPGLVLLSGGLLLALLSLSVSPALLALGLFLLVTVLATLAAPEICLLLLFAAFPLLPLIPQGLALLMGAIALMLLSYLGKLLLGKRRILWEATDLFMLLFALLVLLGGALSPAENRSGVLFGVLCAVMLAGAYFLTANLLTSRRMLTTFVRVLLLPFSLLALGGILRALATLTDLSVFDGAAMRYLLDTVVLTLVTPEELCACLLSLLPLLLILFRLPGRGRPLYLLPLTLFLAAIVLSEKTMAYPVLALTLLFLLLAAMRRRCLFLIPVALLAPHLCLLLPPAALEALARPLLPGAIYTPMHSCLTAWRGALAALGEAPLGIGLVLDENRLSDLLSGQGAGTAGPRHLLLALAVQLGVVGLIASLGLLLSAFRAAGRAHALSPESPYRPLTLGATAALFAFLLFGLQSALLSSPTVALLFSLLLGLLTAACRAAAEEERGYSLRESPQQETASTSVRLTRW